MYSSEDEWTLWPTWLQSSLLLALHGLKQLTRMLKLSHTKNHHSRPTNISDKLSGVRTLKEHKEAICLAANCNSKILQSHSQVTGLTSFLLSFCKSNEHSLLYNWNWKKYICFICYSWSSTPFVDNLPCTILLPLFENGYPIYFIWTS